MNGRMQMPLKTRTGLPIAALAVVSMIPAPAPAQWLNYPTPGVPKTANGKPNLSAPAPKTADGKPDLSGIWRADRRTGPNPCPFNNCQDARGTDRWLDFGAGLPGGAPYHLDYAHNQRSERWSRSADAARG